MPIAHKQPAMESGGAHTPLDLYWNDGNSELTPESIGRIKLHILGFNKVCAGERIDDPADILPFVLADENYQSEIRQLDALIAG